MPIIAHLSVGVRDIEAAKRFYDAALEPLGSGVSRVVRTLPHMATMMRTTSASRDAVELFYRQDVAAGGSDDGVPALRDEYAEDHFGAFLKDPDGQRIEAVCHVNQT